MEWQLLWKYVHTHTHTTWQHQDFTPGAAANLCPERLQIYARGDPSPACITTLGRHSMGIKNFGFAEIFFPSHLFFAGGLVFFLRAPFSAPSVLLASRQAKDTTNTKGKSLGPSCIGRWGKSTGRRRLCRGFRKAFAPAGMLGSNVVRFCFRFAENGGCEGDHGWVGQCGGPACSESRCNPLLAKLLTNAVASSLDLPKPSIASTTKRQCWLLEIYN